MTRPLGGALAAWAIWQRLRRMRRWAKAGLPLELQGPMVIDLMRHVEREFVRLRAAWLARAQAGELSALPKPWPEDGEGLDRIAAMFGLSRAPGEDAAALRERVQRKLIGSWSA